MFSGVPEGIRQAAGHGLSESALLLLHKIYAKQKEQHPIRCCSWCDREDSNLRPFGSENCDTQTKTNGETYILLGLHKRNAKNTRMKKLIPMRVHGFYEGPFTPVVK